VLNTVSKPLPFPISASEEGQEAREEVRLKHRVLDLRWVLGGVVWRLQLVEQGRTCRLSRQRDNSGTTSSLQTCAKAQGF
jgi:hypothetical protein